MSRVAVLHDTLKAAMHASERSVQMDVAKGFGRRLRELREERGISVAKLSRMMGVTPSYIYQIESGRIAIPRPETIKKLAGALRTTPGDFLAAAGYVDTPEIVTWEEIALACEIRKLPDTVRKHLERMVYAEAS